MTLFQAKFLLHLQIKSQEKNFFFGFTPKINLIGGYYNTDMQKNKVFISAKCSLQQTFRCSLAAQSYRTRADARQLQLWYAVQIKNLRHAAQLPQSTGEKEWRKKNRLRLQTQSHPPAVSATSLAKQTNGGQTL